MVKLNELMRVVNTNPLHNLEPFWDRSPFGQKIHRKLTIDGKVDQKE